MAITSNSALPSSQQADSSFSTLLKEYEKDRYCRILSLDGGGAKGFYSLGVLKEIVGKRLTYAELISADMVPART